MDDIPYYKRPWFYIAGWLFFLLVLYGWQVYRLGGTQASLINVLLDLACIFPALLLGWIAFFAQFVLPVQTFEDRRKIFERLLTYLSGGHGPAMFIRNGEIIKREGEERQKGPGVVWLDSASAAVTRTAVKIKQTLGPGVHFLDNGESIANTMDLHIQSQTLGPKSDKPFDPENGVEEQDRRKQVSALTRDGIEVVPNISVSFRVDTGFPGEGKPGSRFGYRTGIAKTDRENEKKDREAIQKALLGEGINPNISSDQILHRVAWNQLPAQLAVDVWREYVAKFTLDELFASNQLAPVPPPPVPEPTEEEIDLLSQPLQASASQNKMEDGLVAMIREINRLMDRAIKWLEGQKKEEPKKVPPPITPPTPPAKAEPQKKTALQAINDMVKARLTQPKVDVLDDHGKRVAETMDSNEYKLLQSRGLKVLSVGIGGVRFHPTIEETIIKGWSAAWLRNANSEKEQIERRTNIHKAAGQEQAIRQYAEKLSADLLRKQPKGAPDTLKTLVMRTRAIIIENEQLRQRMTEDQEVFEEIIKWMEVNGK